MLPHPPIPPATPGMVGVLGVGEGLGEWEEWEVSAPAKHMGRILLLLPRSAGEGGKIWGLAEAYGTLLGAELSLPSPINLQGLQIFHCWAG